MPARRKKQPDRRDVDWSSLFTGICLLFTARVWWKYTHLPARLAKDAVIQANDMLANWTFELNIFNVFLTCLGLLALLTASKETTNAYAGFMGS